ncbi:MAG: MFS transporter [Coriobacteriia bacterium]|nr:MFS transporter [Coriobacteriia bacterium]
MENDISQQKNLKTKHLLGYAAYPFFSLFGALTWAWRNMYFALIGININLLSTAQTIARFVDLAVAIIAGGVIEKVRLRIFGGGKYRPWLFIFIFVITFGIIISFNDLAPGNDAIHFIVVLIGALCVSVSMTFIGAAQFGLVPMFAGASQVDRTRLTTWNYRITTVATIFTSATGAYMLTWFGTLFKPPMNYTVMSSSFAFFYLVGGFILLHTAKPFDPPQDIKPGGPGAPEVKVADMVKAVTTNSQLLIYLLASMFNQIGMLIGMNIIIYFWQLVIPYTHGISPSDSFPGLYTIAQTTTTVTNLVFSMIGPEVGKKLGKDRALWVGMLFGSFSATLNFFFGSRYWLFYVGINMIGMFAGSLSAGFGINYALDCGEYGLWKTGQDHRLVIMSMNTLPGKIAGILGGFVMFALAAIGFDSQAVQAASAAGGIPAFVDDAFVRNYMVLMMGIPAVCRLIAAILIRFFYKIKDADARMYAAENQARREAAAAAAAAAAGGSGE